MAYNQNRIICDPRILAGKPVIRGTRISVEFILEVMAAGWSVADISENYPGVTQDDIVACLNYAREAVETIRAPSAA